MNTCNISEECNAISYTNDMNILLKQIKADVKTLMENTEAKLLLHDRKNSRIMQILKR